MNCKLVDSRNVKLQHLCIIVLCIKQIERRTGLLQKSIWPN